MDLLKAICKPSLWCCSNTLMLLAHKLKLRKRNSVTHLFFLRSSTIPRTAAVLNSRKTTPATTPATTGTTMSDPSPAWSEAVRLDVVSSGKQTSKGGVRDGPTWIGGWSVWQICNAKHVVFLFCSASLTVKIPQRLAAVVDRADEFCQVAAPG